MRILSNPFKLASCCSAVLLLSMAQVSVAAPEAQQSAAAASTPAGTAVAQSKETVSNSSDRKSVSVTIYNSNLALVREERQVNLTDGLNRIAMRGVSAKIQPETATLRALNGAPLHLLEQNFDFDLLTRDALLKKYVGHTVTVIRTNPTTGEDTQENATLLADNDGLVLKYANHIEAGLPPHARLSFADVPANLRDQPTLVVSLDSSEAGPRTVDLSYLTSGMSWRADYVGTLADNGKTMNLAGWVTLTNQSGASYDNARLQLVAGDVNIVQSDNDGNRMVLYGMPNMAEATGMQQQPLFEYHLYTLNRPTDIANNQTKQVALLSAENVPVEKEYRMEGEQHWYYDLRNGGSHPEQGEKRKIEVDLKFKNEGGQLGVPLPKGIVRVYQDDSHKSALFIGEDNIDHTPKGETVRLKLGEAFDLSGTWKNTDVTKISDKVYEMSFSVDLTNAKDEPVTIQVDEPIPGSWTITHESLKHTKPTAHIAQWEVPVPANGHTVLTYTTRIVY